MRVFKWLFLLLVWTLVAAFLHYTLPRNDVVRVVGTPIQRVDVGTRPMFWAASDSATLPGEIRDIRFIEAIDADGDERVYRNEDTGWGWPPFFKFDSANVQARAADLASTRETPQWVAVKHYGWRVPMLSVFPNAVSLRPVAGPDVLVIPWTAIVVLLLLALLFWAIYTRWRRFRAAHIDPRLDRIDAAWEERREARAARRRAKRQSRTNF